jgi:hypothetical protein
VNWIKNFVRPKIRSILGTDKREVPENMWVKDPESGQMVFYKDLEANQHVMPQSGYHMRMPPDVRLKAMFGRSHRYSVDGFIGASPELLIAVSGNQVRSHPLAGTAPRTGDPDTDRRAADELLASEKNQIEHRVVIDMIHDTLLPWCSYLDWEPEPSIVTVAMPCVAPDTTARAMFVDSAAEMPDAAAFVPT